MAVNLNEKPIFVVGAERSGTTMIMALIGAHPRIAVPEVAWLYPKFSSYLHTYGDLNDDDNFRTLADEMLHSLIIPYWGMKLNPITAVEEMIVTARERSFAGLYSAMHEMYAKRNGDKPRWGQKTPHNIFYVDRIKKDFPNAQFVFVTRNGYDAAADALQSSFGPNNAYCAAQDWVKVQNAADKFRKEVPAEDWYDISYEAVCRNPEEELKKLCDFLGEEYTPDMQDFWKGDISQRRKNSKDHQALGHAISDKYVDMYKEKLSIEQQRIITWVAGDQIEKYGYEVSVKPLELVRKDIERYEDADGRIRAALLSTSGILSSESYYGWVIEQRDKRAAAGIWNPETAPKPFPIGDPHEEFYVGRKGWQKYIDMFAIKPVYGDSFGRLFKKK